MIELKKETKRCRTASLSNKRSRQKLICFHKDPKYQKGNKKFKSTKDCYKGVDLSCMKYGTKLQGLREIEPKKQTEDVPLLFLYPLLFKSLDTRWETSPT